jgi:methionyl-tRNA formyltransferase
VSSRLRTVFFGTPDFAVPSLEAALAESDVIAVVTQPDRPRGRGQQVLPCPVKERALEAGVPVFSPPSLRKDSEEKERLFSFWRSHPVDLFCVTAYGNLLPEPVLTVPRLGCVNVHASLLPRWRGAAPIQRALEAGDKETGVCLQKMVLEMDAGDVVSETRLPLDPEMQAGELTDLLSRMGGELLAAFLHGFRGEHIEGTPQNSSFVTLAPKIKKEEGFWDSSWSIRETHDKVRAFGVWPGVKAKLAGGLELKIARTRALAPGETVAAAPAAGEIVLLGGRALLGARDGVLELVEIQPANKGVVKAFDFLQNEARKAASGGQSGLRLLKPQG